MKTEISVSVQLINDQENERLSTPCLRNQNLGRGFLGNGPVAGSDEQRELSARQVKDRPQMNRKGNAKAGNLHTRNRHDTDTSTRRQESLHQRPLFSTAIDSKRNHWMPFRVDGCRKENSFGAIFVASVSFLYRVGVGWMGFQPKHDTTSENTRD